MPPALAARFSANPGAKVARKYKYIKKIRPYKTGLSGNVGA